MSEAGARRLFLPALCVLGMLIFGALGVWQIERLAWKRDLIARVEARVNAPPASLPPAARWRSLPPRDLEYRRVRLTGRFDHGAEVLVDALTERGPGFWIVTPLVSSKGTVLVNRGFVPPERKARDRRSESLLTGQVIITGLVRLSEPGGRFLRTNEPGNDRWYSRDIEAISRARGLGSVAPFFIDADASPNPGGWPVGGMTVIRFRNTHLIYALTWFALAGLCVAGLVLTLRSPQIGD